MGRRRRLADSALLVRRHAGGPGALLSYTVVPRPVHYVQLSMHTSIYLYWGWYWREVYHYAPLIVAQIVFVYVLDMLVCWWRRDQWILGFGPFPIVLSTNLFLWFKDDWFFLQFLLVSTGVLCKEFITLAARRPPDAYLQPVAIALAIFSIGLLITHSTRPHVGRGSGGEPGPPAAHLPGDLRGGAGGAGVVLRHAGHAGCRRRAVCAEPGYTGATGLYYFVDSNIPIAVFLGLHLLVTDPATSPRKNFGKLLFGAMYGGLVWALYSVLGWMGAPTFYDKLLCVPPLNLLVSRWTARAPPWKRVSGKMSWTPRQVNFAHMAVWIALFAVMITTGFVGGPASGQRPGILAQGL